MQSLQAHVDKVHPGMKIISSSEKTVTKEEYVEKKCEKCGLDAKYLTNFIGKEKLLCGEHKKRFVEKNSALPVEMWFCQLL